MASTIDFEALDERELLRMLEHVYGELLGRVAVHFHDGVGEPGDAEPRPLELDLGAVLTLRIEALSAAFLEGERGDSFIMAANGDTWTVGLNHFKRELAVALAESDMEKVGDAR